MRVCVYGAASEVSPHMMSCARQIGRLIGSGGDALTYGGFGDGVLGEVARGVHETGGSITAVLPAADRAGRATYEHCDLVLRSPDKRERKRLQVANADLFVVMPMGIGVMDELFEVLVLKSYGELSQRVLLCNIDHCYDTLLRLLGEQGALQYVEPFGSVDEFEDLLAHL